MLEVEVDTEQLETHGKFLSAEELNLSEERRCALIKTLAFIESGKTTHVGLIGRAIPGKGTRFNMAVWRKKHPCGTVACLGGTAEMLSGVDFGGGQTAQLRKLFGFTGSLGRGLPDYSFMAAVTEKQAAVTLRGYLETGKVDWSHAFPS